MSKQKIKVVVALAFVGVFGFTGLISPAFLSRTVVAKPAFMDRYDRDPYSRIKLRGKCTVCHIGRGGGERNDFGEAFEDTGFRITPKLRQKFPEVFENQKPIY